MINIFEYHWVWYLIGFGYVPRLTFMIWISIYFSHTLPLPLIIYGWCSAILHSITFKGK